MDGQSIGAMPVILRDGTRVTVRTLRPEDAEELAGYFLGLSVGTRALYGPHPFDRETAAALCAAVRDGTRPDELRIVASGP
jgi:hypothetical protein